jgi:hypothetical protein
MEAAASARGRPTGRIHATAGISASASLPDFRSGLLFAGASAPITRSSALHACATYWATSRRGRRRTEGAISLNQVFGVSVGRPVFAKSYVAVSRLGGLPGELLASVRYAPDSDQIPYRSAMTRWAKSRRFLTGPRDQECPHGASASSKSLASFKSSVSKPSVNQP